MGYQPVDRDDDPPPRRQLGEGTLAYIHRLCAFYGYKVPTEEITQRIDFRHLREYDAEANIDRAFHGPGAEG